MTEYCVDGNYFENLQLLSSTGRESNVYLDLFTYNMPMCIKKYKSSFWYDCSNDEALKKMFLLQEKLAGFKNISPSIVFYDINEYKRGNKRLLAIGIPYLQNYISIDKIDDISSRFICIRNLLILLEKFISLGIYPTDLNNSNIMVSSDLNVQLIDLDGNQCKVNSKTPGKYYRQIFNSIRYRILTDLMVNDEEYNAAHKYSSLNEGLRAILKQKGFNADIINVVLESQEESKLDILLKVLNEIEPFYVETKDKSFFRDSRKHL